MKLSQLKLGEKAKITLIEPLTPGGKIVDYSFSGTVKERKGELILARDIDGGGYTGYKVSPAFDHLWKVDLL